MQLVFTFLAPFLLIVGLGLTITPIATQRLKQELNQPIAPEQRQRQKILFVVGCFCCC